MNYHHLFGPVHSRRLGSSLGIDLVPFKTCSYDCVYCECGPTTNKTSKRESFLPLNKIFCELNQFLSLNPHLDYITFSGSGEPTLSLDIGRVIGFLKESYPEYKVAVLTNGSLMSDSKVRNDLLKADLILPTFSTMENETFLQIHRPVSGIKPFDLLEGLIKFRKEFSGEIWLEIFLIPGINTGESEILKLRNAIQQIRPDRIQLNTLDRPGSENWVKPVDSNELAYISNLLDIPGIETIDLAGSHLIDYPNYPDNSALIVEMLKRRPCTIEDLIQITGLRPVEVNKKMREITEKYSVEIKEEKRGIFYSIRVKNKK